MHDANPSHLDLQAIAKRIMEQRGFEPDFPAAVSDQLATLRQSPPRIRAGGDIRDLRSLLWSSIDNDTSRDLDQIEVAERAPNGDVKVMIGIADVDAFVPSQTPIDQHAATETTTVYTGVRNFPMLPEELSTGITSLLEEQDRLAIIIEFVIGSSGAVTASKLYRALVRNRAQLQYNSVGAWLEGAEEAPAKIHNSNDLQEQLKLQDEVAQRLKGQRQQQGADGRSSSPGAE
jgi:exoribonuclease R